MQKIVIIGANSYLATGLNKKLANSDIKYLNFYDWQKNISILDTADIIINFSINPAFSTRDMNIDEIIDVQIAKTIKNSKAQFIFMSSRKVYGSSTVCKKHNEEDPLIGVDFYAKNKIKTEKALQEILDDRVTILRISNIIGEPIFREGYKTFIGWICENIILKGELVITQNSNAEKDFITKDFLHKSIISIINNNVKGIINVSAGFPTTVKTVLMGYVGKENLKFCGENLPCLDQFVLDNTRLKKIITYDFTQHDLERYLEKCHQNLLSMRESYNKSTQLNKVV